MQRLRPAVPDACPVPRPWLPVGKATAVRRPQGALKVSGWLVTGPAGREPVEAWGCSWTGKGPPPARGGRGPGVLRESWARVPHGKAEQPRTLRLWAGGSGDVWGASAGSGARVRGAAGSGRRGSRAWSLPGPGLWVRPPLPSGPTHLGRRRPRRAGRTRRGNRSRTRPPPAPSCRAARRASRGPGRAGPGSV